MILFPPLPPPDPAPIARTNRGERFCRATGQEAATPAAAIMLLQALRKELSLVDPTTEATRL
eukprot:scaffold1954_cov268-Pinguiococcus_pyrenoidosus.AAC.308